MHPVLSAFSPIRNLKQLFVRPPGNFPVLDGFRALSMLMILVFHTFGVYGLFHPDIEVMDLVEESESLKPKDVGEETRKQASVKVYIQKSTTRRMMRSRKR